MRSLRTTPIRTTRRVKDSFHKRACRLPRFLRCNIFPCAPPTKITLPGSSASARSARFRERDVASLKHLSRLLCDIRCDLAVIFDDDRETSQPRLSAPLVANRSRIWCSLRDARGNMLDLKEILVVKLDTCAIFLPSSPSSISGGLWCSDDSIP